jgi:ADP-ribose pyrophosphatase YjhB (NUDIX family)
MPNPETNSFIDQLISGNELYLPSVSVDCVIFGFHAGQLKVLLLQSKYNHKWALPGGFIYKNENVENAAIRVLNERTQLKDIFLQQFYLFGDVKRSEEKHAEKLLAEAGIKNLGAHWLMQRFVTAGYYALVEYAKVKPVPDVLSNACTWHSVTELPELIIDHKEIIEKGLEALRRQLKYQPVGYNLLPEVFTIKELQLIYETILGKKLDRANFQRKILSYGILDRQEKQYSGGAHKAPYLYSFNKESYYKALEHGLAKEW